MRKVEVDSATAAGVLGMPEPRSRLHLPRLPSTNVDSSKTAGSLTKRPTNIVTFSRTSQERLAISKKARREHASSRSLFPNVMDRDELLRRHSYMPDQMVSSIQASEIQVVPALFASVPPWSDFLGED
jgi:hypothetical protein